MTAELNDHIENPVSSKTVRRELHTAGFHGRAAIRKPHKNFQPFPLFCPTPVCAAEAFTEVKGVQ